MFHQTQFVLGHLLADLSNLTARCVICLFNYFIQSEKKILACPEMESGKFFFPVFILKRDI